MCSLLEKKIYTHAADVKQHTLLITTYLNLDRNDNRYQLLVKFLHHNQLLQSQTTQPTDKNN